MNSDHVVEAAESLVVAWVLARPMGNKNWEFFDAQDGRWRPGILAFEDGVMRHYLPHRVTRFAHNPAHGGFGQYDETGTGAGVAVMAKPGSAAEASAAQESRRRGGV